jgi:hypothetical protein
MEVLYSGGQAGVEAETLKEFCDNDFLWVVVLQDGDIDLATCIDACAVIGILKHFSQTSRDKMCVTSHVPMSIT